MTKDKLNIDAQVKEPYYFRNCRYEDEFYTKTSLFLLPCIGLSMQNRYIKKFMVNAFLNDVEFENDYKRPIFLLLKSKTLRETDFRDFCQAIAARKDYVTDYYVGYDSGHLIMYAFDVQDKWKEEYYHFKLGRYSKMSDEYKKLFPREIVNNKGRTVESRAWQAMTKSDNLRKIIEKEFFDDQDAKYVDTLEELWGLPVKDIEYYRYKKLVE